MPDDKPDSIQDHVARIRAWYGVPDGVPLHPAHDPRPKWSLAPGVIESIPPQE